MRHEIGYLIHEERGIIRFSCISASASLYPPIRFLLKQLLVVKPAGLLLSEKKVQHGHCTLNPSVNFISDLMYGTHLCSQF